MNFISDKVLDDFYSVITTDPCIRCSQCGDRHPIQNAVYRMDKNNDSKEVYCVWCAVKKGIKKSFASIAPSDRRIRFNRVLCSLDRAHDQNSAGWALNMCCICWTPLYNPDEKDTTKIAIISCNHTAHQECLYLKKKIGTFECKLCCEVRNFTNIEERDAHTKEYFEKLKYTPDGGRKQVVDYNYLPCSKCLQLHPESNTFQRKETLSYNCVWCELECRDQERLVIIKKEHEKMRLRSNSMPNKIKSNSVADRLRKAGQK